MSIYFGTENKATNKVMSAESVIISQEQWSTGNFNYYVSGAFVGTVILSFNKDAPQDGYENKETVIVQGATYIKMSAPRYDIQRGSIQEINQILIGSGEVSAVYVGGTQIWSKTTKGAGDSGEGSGETTGGDSGGTGNSGSGDSTGGSTGGGTKPPIHSEIN